MKTKQELQASRDELISHKADTSTRIAELDAEIKAMEVLRNGDYGYVNGFSKIAIATSQGKVTCGGASFHSPGGSQLAPEDVTGNIFDDLKLNAVDRSETDKFKFKCEYDEDDTVEVGISEGLVEISVDQDDDMCFVSLTPAQAKLFHQQLGQIIHTMGRAK